MKAPKYNVPKGVYQRGERTFRFRVYNGSDSNGNPIVHYMKYEVSSTAKRDIEKELTTAFLAFEKAVKEGCYVDTRITLKEYYYKHWLPSYAQNLSPAEREGNVATLEREYLPIIGEMPLVSIRRINIQEITDNMATRGLSGKTIRKYHSQIASVFNEALRLEMINASPCDRIRFPKIKKKNEIRVFTAQQAMRFLEACKYGVSIYYPESVRKNGKPLPAHTETVGGNYQLYTLYNLALNSGMRRGELAGLEWVDVDFKRNQINVCQSASKAKSEGGFFIKETKTATSNRVISIPASVMENLKEWKLAQSDIRKNLGSAWKGKKDLVFTSEDGNGIDLNYPVRAMHRLLEAFNKTVEAPEQLPMLTLHELRHTHATLLIQAGVPISEVSRRLGHSDIAVTLSVYAHWLPENDKRASDAIADVFEKAQSTEEIWNEFGTNYPAMERNVTQRS